MKKIAFSILLVLGVTSTFAQKFENFGSKIKPTKAEQISVLTKDNSLENKTVKVEGEVESVCQAAGCWMKVKLDNGKTMRVTFKDYSFFVPKDLAGTKVIFEGTPSVKTTSVDELKHYAEDAGKTKEEIAKITEPKVELTFLANGVLVPKK
jgi:Domain of unknown function (DUF4920)